MGFHNVFNQATRNYIWFCLLIAVAAPVQLLIDTGPATELSLGIAIAIFCIPLINHWPIGVAVGLCFFSIFANQRLEVGLVPHFFTGAVAASAFAFKKNYAQALIFCLAFLYLSSTSILQGKFIPDLPVSAAIALILLCCGFAAGIGNALSSNSRQREKEALEHAKHQKESTIQSLHDSIASTLTCTVQRSNLLLINESLPEDARRSIEKILQEQHKALNEVRELIRNIDLEFPEAETNYATSVKTCLHDFATSLKDFGFTVEQDSTPTTTNFLKRIHHPTISQVFSELFTNLVKYADHSHPINIAITQNQGRLNITIGNKIARSRANSHLTTKLGLKGIENLITSENGQLISESNSHYWVTTVLLPIKG